MRGDAGAALQCRQNLVEKVNGKKEASNLRLKDEIIWDRKLWNIDHELE
jgi:hypothetical protein